MQNLLRSILNLFLQLSSLWPPPHVHSIERPWTSLIIGADHNTGKDRQRQVNKTRKRAILCYSFVPKLRLELESKLLSSDWRQRQENHHHGARHNYRLVVLDFLKRKLVVWNSFEGQPSWKLSCSQEISERPSLKKILPWSTTHRESFGCQQLSMRRESASKFVLFETRQMDPPQPQQNKTVYGFNKSNMGSWEDERTGSKEHTSVLAFFVQSASWCA